MHYKNQSSKYENNLKGIWNVIKEIIVKKKLISPISSKLIVDNLEITDIVFTLISAPGTYQQGNSRYRIYSNQCPWHLLNFETVRLGTYFKAN